MQFKENLAKMTWPVDTKMSPKAPEKTYGAAKLQSSQKNLDFSRLQTKLGCVLSFLENANTLLYTNTLLK